MVDGSMCDDRPHKAKELLNGLDGLDGLNDLNDLNDLKCTNGLNGLNGFDGLNVLKGPRCYATLTGEDESPAVAKISSSIETPQHSRGTCFHPSVQSRSMRSTRILLLFIGQGMNFESPFSLSNESVCVYIYISLVLHISSLYSKQLIR